MPRVKRKELKLKLKDIFVFTKVKEGDDLLSNDKWHENGLPPLVDLKPVKGKSDVWKFMRVLCIPITEEIVTTGRKSKSLQFSLKASAVKTYHHLCLLCLEDVMDIAVENRHNESWSKDLFKVANTGNGLNHLLRCHSGHPSQHCRQVAKNNLGK